MCTRFIPSNDKHHARDSLHTQRGTDYIPPHPTATAARLNPTHDNNLDNSNSSKLQQTFANNLFIYAIDRVAYFTAAACTLFLFIHLFSPFLPPAFGALVVMRCCPFFFFRLMIVELMMMNVELFSGWCWSGL